MCAARTYRLEDQIIQFLTGLNENFSIVKTRVLLMDLLPINKVFSFLCNHALLNPVTQTSDESSYTTKPTND
jgi:hypothetical protein